MLWETMVYAITKLSKEFGKMMNKQRMKDCNCLFNAGKELEAVLCHVDVIFSYGLKF